MDDSHKNTGTAHIDVAYVADLARIELTDEEVAAYSQELNQVLDYMQKLKEIDVSAVEPTAHASAGGESLREDQCHEPLDREEVVANFPDTDANCVRVPPIIEDQSEEGA